MEITGELRDRSETTTLIVKAKRGEELDRKDLESQIIQWGEEARGLGHHAGNILCSGKKGQTKLEFLLDLTDDPSLDYILEQARSDWPQVSEIHVDAGHPAMLPVPRLANDEKNQPYIPTWIEIGPSLVRFEDGRTEHIERFRIADRSVTIREFMVFVGATGYVTTGHREGDLYQTFDGNACVLANESKNRLETPVDFVSYEDAVAFCDWSGTRLPADGEWLAALVPEFDQPSTSKRSNRSKSEEVPNWVIRDGLAEQQACARYGPRGGLPEDYGQYEYFRVWPTDYHDHFLSIRVVAK